TAVWMFLIIYFWTPPHFWALSLVIKKDYERAGVPMLPVVAGAEGAVEQIVLYTLLLVSSTRVLFSVGTVGLLYLLSALWVALGLGLLYLTIRLARERTLKQARTVFWFSNYYLVLIFAAMVIDHALR